MSINSDDVSLAIGTRLKEERLRLGMSQQVFGARGGVVRTAQTNYEQGNRMPDAKYLGAVAALGVDVLYVITGRRDISAMQPAQTVQEQLLLLAFRRATKEVCGAALRVLDVPIDSIAEKAAGDG